MATILVVDDEPLVLQVVSHILTSRGHWVLPASSAQRAIAAFEAEVDIDLLITDLQMPGMDGRQLARHFCQKYPKSPVLYMTAYFLRPDAATPSARFDGHRVLVKPFRPATLLEFVNDLLHTGSSAE